MDNKRVVGALGKHCPEGFKKELYNNIQKAIDGFKKFYDRMPDKVVISQFAMQGIGSPDLYFEYNDAYEIPVMACGEISAVLDVFAHYEGLRFTVKQGNPYVFSNEPDLIRYEHGN